MTKSTIGSRISRVLLLFLLFTLLATPLTAWGAAADSTNSSSGSSNSEATATSNTELELIQEIMNYIEKYNIQGVSKDELVRAAIQGMTATLEDPYTAYYNADEYAALEAQMNGSFVGIGVSFMFIDQYIEIQRVYANSPAAEAGILAGDRVTKVNGLDIKDDEDYATRITGPEGSSVTLTILRGNQTLQVTMKRSTVHIEDVSSQLIESAKGIGYMTIEQFSTDADELFATQFQALKEQGMKSLVLDLRDNLGGYVDSAANIAKHFIDKGLLMYTKDQSDEFVPTAIFDGEKSNLDVYLLINEFTASSSEILAGALQDQDVALLIGTTSYGKGRIQSMIPLSDGGLLKITSQAYITPNKNDFNYIGIDPDLEVKGRLAQLIAGLKLAGLEDITLTSVPGATKLNDHAVLDRLEYVEKDGKVYVSARTLGALVQADLAWNTSKQELQFTASAGQKSTFSIASKTVIMKDETTYLELSAFQKAFSGFTWLMKGDSVTITAKGY